jgi:hypothetical protein
VGYWLMQRWLQDFVYRIKISPGIFFATLFISMGLAWVTVGYKSIGAAMVNPAKSLKTE